LELGDGGLKTRELSFTDFNNRMNEYFSTGCGCAMNMALCEAP